MGFSPAPEANPPKGVNDVSAPGTELGFAPAADAGSHHGVDLGCAPAADVESHHAMDLGFAPAADAEPHHALDLGFAPAADDKAQHVMGSEFGPAADAEFAPAPEVNHHHALDSEFAPAAPAKPLPAVDAGNVSVEAQPVPAAAPRIAVSEELLTSEAALQQDKSPAGECAQIPESQSQIIQVGKGL